MLSIILLSATEGELMKQSILIDRFFEKIDDSFMYQVNQGMLPFHVCAWRPLTKLVKLHCDGGLLTSLEISDCFLEDFQLSFLPPTVEHVSIVNCRQHGTFEARHLPRDAHFVSFPWNHLQGTIDLQRLPSHIFHINLNKNQLTGSIKLTELPPKIETIEVEFNNLIMKTLYYDDLPECLTEVRLKGNSIQEIRPIHKRTKRAQKSIFLHFHAPSKIY